MDILFGKLLIGPYSVQYIIYHLHIVLESFFNTAEPLITVTFAQRPKRPDLRPKEKFLPKSCRNYSQTLINKPPHSGHLQSTVKRLLDVVPMSNFTSINGQTDKPQKLTEKYIYIYIYIYFYLENIYFLKIISF